LLAQLYLIEYTLIMYNVRSLPEFDAWLTGLRDVPTRIRLARRLDKVRRGILGDVKFVGDSVYEMREFFGPGWRMYYVIQGDTLIVMLGGGDKSTQQADIEAAKTWACTLKE
jgi:putative addiction module killer protein